MPKISVKIFRPFFASSPPPPLVSSPILSRLFYFESDCKLNENLVSFLKGNAKMRISLMVDRALKKNKQISPSFSISFKHLIFRRGRSLFLSSGTRIQNCIDDFVCSNSFLRPKELETLRRCLAF